MSNRTLIMYEISQKQNYILRTNRLLENTGGSNIIRDLTEEPHKFFQDLSEKKILDVNIELPKSEEKIVGGGSATYIFKEKDEANKFSKRLSSTIIRYFPGLELFLVQETMDWMQDKLYSTKEDGQGIISKMRDRLSEKKDHRKSAIFQKSWGIHQACPNTGLPANKYVYNKYKKEKELLAEEVHIKEKVGKNVRNKEYEKRFIINPDSPLQPLKNKNYRFMEQGDHEEIFRIDDTDSKGKSYLSIIALDGNAMGVKVQKFLSQEFETNDDYIAKYKEFTEKVDTAYSRAFQKTIDYVMTDFDNWAPKVYGHRLEDDEFYNRVRNMIPIRPVILSGDDVSFITLGMLGLEIARVYLEYLQAESISINNENHPMNACAGVAIIPHRYPFWLGFELADKLCENGKERLERDAKYWEKIEELKNEETYDTSLIDWQIIQTGGAVEDIDSYRKENYVTKDGARLSMRPYYVQHPDEQTHFSNYKKAFYRAVDVIERTIKKSESQEESVYPGRSKWKELRDVYHQGREAVNDWVLLNQFFALDDQKKAVRISDKFYFPFYTEGENEGDYGFRLINDDVSTEGIDYAFYYDVLEAMDYFVKLSEVEENDEHARDD